MYAINQKHQKEYNRSLVLHSLYSTPGLSRAELAKQLNLKKSSLTPIIADLINLGIVTEVGFGEGRKEGGRKPIQLTLNDELGGVVGIDFQPEVAYITLITLGGKILYKGVHDFVAEQRQSSMIEKFEIVYQEVMEKAEEYSLRVLGVSLGVPGWVNNKDGIVLHSIPFALEDYNFAKAVAALDLPMPVLIENDANCGAWSEVHRGEESVQDFLFLLFVNRPSYAKDKSFSKSGVALGLGITLNGEIYTGHHFSAGDFTSAFWTTSQSGQVGISDEIMTSLLAADAADQGTSSVARNYLQEILQNLVPVITTLAPDKIILGGDACGKLPLVKDIISQELGKGYLAQEGHEELFTESVYGLYASAYGAAKRFLWELFYPVVPTQKEPYYYQGLKSLFNN